MASKYFVNALGDIKTVRELQTGEPDFFTIEGKDLEIRRGKKGEPYAFVSQCSSTSTECQPFKREALTVMGILARHDLRSLAFRALLEAPQGTEIKCSFVSVSRSGMSRRLKAYMVHNGDLINLAGIVNDFPQYFSVDDNNAFIIGGCGTDVGFQVAYDMGYLVHGDGYHFRKYWI